jgi:DNA-binding MarR family transcriptional regulator
LSYQGDLTDEELQILRYLRDHRGEPRAPSDIAPHVGLSADETTDRLNELEWVGYVEEHTGADGSGWAFSLTPDGLQAATGS